VKINARLSPITKTFSAENKKETGKNKKEFCEKQSACVHNIPFHSPSEMDYSCLNRKNKTCDMDYWKNC
jgi:hypothetical protein